MPVKNKSLHEVRCQPAVLKQGPASQCKDLSNHQVIRQRPSEMRREHEPKALQQQRPEIEVELYQCDLCQTFLEIGEKDDHLFAHSLADQDEGPDSSHANPSQLLDEEAIDQYVEGPPGQHMRERGMSYELEMLSLNSVGGLSDSSYEPGRNLEDEHYDGDALTRSGIEELPLIKFDITMTHELTECIICLGEFANDETLLYLPCFHYLHSECASSWLIRKAECPICKSLV